MPSGEGLDVLLGTAQVLHSAGLSVIQTRHPPGITLAPSVLPWVLMLPFNALMRKAPAGREVDLGVGGVIYHRLQTTIIGWGTVALWRCIAVATRCGGVSPRDWATSVRRFCPAKKNIGSIFALFEQRTTAARYRPRSRRPAR